MRVPLRWLYQATRKCRVSCSCRVTKYESRARVRTLKFILKHSKTMHDYMHAQHVTTRTHPTLEHQHQHSYPALPLPCVVRLSALRIASFNVGWVVRVGEGALGIEPSSL